MNTSGNAYFFFIIIIIIIIFLLCFHLFLGNQNSATKSTLMCCITIKIWVSEEKFICFLLLYSENLHPNMFHLDIMNKKVSYVHYHNCAKFAHSSMGQCYTHNYTHFCNKNPNYWSNFTQNLESDLFWQCASI